MSKARITNDDEIDLFIIFETLWNEKLLISAFSFIALLISSVLLFFSVVTYTSKMTYSENIVPAFYDQGKVSADFKKMFFSETLFEEWKKNSNSSTLVFQDFSNSKIVDGFILKKNETEQLAKLDFDKNIGSFILVRTKHLPTIDDFYKYANYINKELSASYIKNAKEELKIINSRFQGVALDSIGINAYASLLLPLERFIVQAEKGSGLLSIQHPTFPKKISPSSLLILLFSALLGVLIGIVFVLFRNAIRNYKSN